jgi:transposase
MRENNIVLTAEERKELRVRTRSRSLRADDARRARLILMLADGASYRRVEERIGCDTRYVRLWKKRFLAERLAGLFSRHQGRKATVLVPKMEAKILAATRRKPTDGSTHWSTRRLAKHLGVDHMLVARVWARAGIKPHRIERYMRSTDPDFEAKTADVIGLYLNPP